MGLVLSSLRMVQFCKLPVPTDCDLPSRTPALPHLGRPAAHLRIGSLLQSPLFPLPLQPLKLFSDFSWSSPPFHNLWADRGESTVKDPGSEENTHRADGVNWVCTPCPGLRELSVKPRGGFHTGCPRPWRGQGRFNRTASQLCAPVIPKVLVSRDLTHYLPHFRNLSLKLQESYNENLTSSLPV